MKLVIHPDLDPSRQFDVTGVVVGAIAQELWRMGGTNAVVNWLEAERHVDRMIQDAARRLATQAPHAAPSGDPSPSAPAPDDLRADAPLGVGVTRRGKRPASRGAKGAQSHERPTGMACNC